MIDNRRWPSYLFLLLLLILPGPAFAQSVSEPKFAAVQLGHKTVMVLPANWTATATQGTIELRPSTSIQNASAPYWWNTTVKPDKIIFKLVQNVGKPSKFVILTNSTQVTYNYDIVLNNTNTYSGKIVVPEQSENKQSRFFRWTDDKEKAATAFIPENWSADIQIIRPYKSMTGFVFFARGSNHTLVYMFQPFMPLHLLPNDSLCKSIQLCPGSISTDKVRELSFGNAPLLISVQKTPEQYFASEILPLLRKNLRSYNVESTSSTFAFTIDREDLAISLLPAYDFNYTFDSDGKKIDGRAMVFTKNYTSGAVGVWNGIIVGVESLDKNFDTAFQQAVVPLLTLQFDKKWLDAEKHVLLENSNSTNALNRVSQIMANETLDDFDEFSSTAAHKMVNTYNNTRVAGFIDNATKQELHLPLFPDSQHWYLDGDRLIGKKVDRNPMKANTLQALFL